MLGVFFADLRRRFPLLLLMPNQHTLQGHVNVLSFRIVCMGLYYLRYLGVPLVVNLLLFKFLHLSI